MHLILYSTPSATHFLWLRFACHYVEIFINLCPEIVTAALSECLTFAGQIFIDMGKIVCKNFKATGMGCAGCAARIENTLSKVDGVKNASVSFVSGRAKVEFDDGICSTEKLVAAVENAGYGLVGETDEDGENDDDADADGADREDIDEDEEDAAEAAEKRERRSLKIKTIVSAVLSVTIMLFCKTDWKYAGVAMCILAVPAVFWCGGGFFVSAWKQLRHRSSSMDTLVSLSTGISFIFSLFTLIFPSFWTTRGMEPHLYFESASMVVTFVLAGRMLEQRARHQTTSAIRKLIGLRPKKVTMLDHEEKPVVISVKDVRKGNILIARPGERIAVDGTVIGGRGYVDESTFTGEPMPVGKAEGDKVYEGTMVTDGSMEYRAEKVGKETRLSGIIRLVRDAADSKAPVQRLVDRISAVFVPVIIGISFLTFVLWTALMPEDGLAHGIMAAVTVLVIACPCALGLATPTAIAVGVGRGAENGILIKDAECLEKAAKVDVVTLDKTGTLTQGHPQVTRTAFVQESKKEQALKGLSALESHSSHPLAKAINNYVTQLYPSHDLSVSDFFEIPGGGVKGGLVDCNGTETKAVAGNLQFLSKCGISVPQQLKSAAESMTGSTVWYAGNGQALAVVEISDNPRESAKEGVAKLKSMDIEVVMLTGDRKSSAEKIADKVGIGKVKSGMMPEDKLRHIRDLQKEGKCVAMVGDGINDSAALSQADVSIAIGGGSDIAVDAAGITLETPDIRKIADAVRLSKNTMKTLKENLFWAFIYNAVGIPIAAGVLYPAGGFMLSPAVAGAAMALSSISVVTNSLRLKYRK